MGFLRLCMDLSRFLWCFLGVLIKNKFLDIKYSTLILRPPQWLEFRLSQVTHRLTYFFLEDIEVDNMSSAAFIFFKKWTRRWLDLLNLVAFGFFLFLFCIVFVILALKKIMFFYMYFWVFFEFIFKVISLLSNFLFLYLVFF